MKAQIDAGDRTFLERLRRLGAATIQELCAEVGVTATAVRQRLGRLLVAGLIHRTEVRAGRGRPHHTYEISAAGLRELSENYADLALILWRELRGIQDVELRSRVYYRVQSSFVERYGALVHGETVTERFSELQQALSERGFDVEIGMDSGLPILRENNCPYYELASADPEICEMEQGVFERVLGVPVELTACCLDGHHCCEFRPASVPPEVVQPA